MQRSDDLGLFVIDEEDSETLLSHRINPDDIYRKQEGISISTSVNTCFSSIPCLKFICSTILDTIISWRDPEYSTELALSFQENAGCSYIWYWKLLCVVGICLKFSFLALVLTCFDHMQGPHMQCAEESTFYYT